MLYFSYNVPVEYTALFHWSTTKISLCDNHEENVLTVKVSALILDTRLESRMSTVLVRMSPFSLELKVCQDQDLKQSEPKSSPGIQIGK